MANKPKLNETVLPPKELKEAITIDFQRQLTWKERLQVLIGYTLVIQVAIATQHRVGRVWHRETVKASKALLATRSAP